MKAILLAMSLAALTAMPIGQMLGGLGVAADCPSCGCGDCCNCCDGGSCGCDGSCDCCGAACGCGGVDSKVCECSGCGLE